jgi:glycerophosphoryl diester phosphodiesterase
VSDFTLPEIKKLSEAGIRQSPQQYNNQYAIVTLKKYCFDKTKIKRIRTQPRIYPETKHPSFMKQNLHIMDKLLEELTAGWNNEEAPVYVQSLRFQTCSIFDLNLL